MLGHCMTITDDYELIEKPECCENPAVRTKFEDCCRDISEGDRQDCFEPQAPLDACAQRILKPTDLARRPNHNRNDVCCFNDLIQDKLDNEWANSGMKEFCCRNFNDALNICTKRRSMSREQRIRQVRGLWLCSFRIKY